jgi:hypothetical protein
MSLAVYYAPTYFSPSYFLPLVAAARSSAPSAPITRPNTLLDTSIYFTPTYFSPFYFPSFAITANNSQPPVGSGYRDRDAYGAIIQALESTGEFAAIVLGSSIDHVAGGADRDPVAVILPSEWSEIDDVDPPICLRLVGYTLTLIVRAEDADERLQRVDRLTSVVQNAIDGSDLNGGCLSGLTKLRRGRYDAKSRHPEQRLTLTGTFAYLISTQTGHDTTA